MEFVCNICPRECGARRDDFAGDGVCKSGSLPRLARAGLHFWEEPVISGENGSGTVFFSGCPLKCVFCQNSEISAANFGKTVTASRLQEIYGELIKKGAHNINLVTPTHWANVILKSLEPPLPVPVVYNSGGYEKLETLRKFEGKIDIYLPDMKYTDTELAGKYSSAPDYPETAKAAILEMYRQVGRYKINGGGIMERGVIIRHLVLPGALDNTKAVIDWVAGTFSPGQVLFSLMSQYTPAGDIKNFPELQRRITQDEYDAAVEYLESSGIEDGFFQELSSAKEEYIPPFDLEGV